MTDPRPTYDPPIEFEDFNPNDYLSFVLPRAKPAEALVSLVSSDPERAHLLHMAVGVAGEAGELLDALKKHCIYGKPLDIKNVVEELGDLEFYITHLRASLGLTRSAILRANMAKLSQRYATRYTDAEAIARADKSGQ